MIRSIGTVLAVTMIIATTAAAAEQQRIRGTIEAFDQNSLTVESRKGEQVKVMLGEDTAFVYVVDSDLSAIDDNTFIGVATKDVRGMPMAIEVVVFPESMRGMGEGNYPWDKLPDTTVTGDAAVSTEMTNATVESGAAAGNQPLVDTAMTNATVKASESQKNSRLLTVTYDDGEKMQIMVPPTAPIVAFDPKDRSVLKEGAHVFIIAAKQEGGPAAKLVAVGKDGLVPPM